MPPEKVVDASLHAMRKRRRPLVVPGLGDRALEALCRVTPRRWMVPIMGGLGELAQDRS